MVVVCLSEQEHGQYSYLHSAAHCNRRRWLADLPTRSTLHSPCLIESQKYIKVGHTMSELGACENVRPTQSHEVFGASEDHKVAAHTSHSTSRSRRKLGRGDSKTWFNKSFDQTVLNQASRPKPQKVMRRQNSVTDFFHSMLTKSKTQLQDLFASKKGKAHQKTGGSGEISASASNPVTRDNSELEGTAGAEGRTSGSDGSHHLRGDMKNVSPYNSGSMFRGSKQVSPHRNPSNVSDKQPVNRRSDPVRITSRTVRQSLGDGNPLANPPDIDMFLTSKPIQHSDRSESGSELTSPKLLSSPSHEHHKPFVKRTSLSFLADRSKLPIGAESANSSASSSAAVRRKQMSHSSSLSPSLNHAPRTIVTFSSYDSAESAEEVNCERSERDEARRSVSSAPASRMSTCWDGPASSSLLAAGGGYGGKRTLVKSNSDTFERMDNTSLNFLSSSSPQLVYKASSDGQSSLTQFLASGVKSVGTVMIKVTDYLFLGSIEAAYSEPVLCKYGISSLIDMTNMNPALVPAHKKSDCPCACAANKTPHFRSKLNIGVDDIEWENLEQYFDEINSFINGARRKGRRVLVFSYMGQSRAAAAVVQHLMTHYKMPYQDAMTVVRSKRPQIKLNSGFVKALRRLEKKLGLTTDEAGGGKGRLGQFECRGESPVVSRGSIEAIQRSSPPPVVRGAWLEC